MQTRLITDFRDWRTVLNKMNYDLEYGEDEPSNPIQRRELEAFFKVMDEVFHAVDKGERENNARITINSIFYPTRERLIELSKQFPEIYPSKDGVNVDYRPRANISVSYADKKSTIKWCGKEFPHHIGLEEITAGQEDIGKTKGKVSLNKLPEIACGDIGPNPASLEFQGYSLIWNGSTLRIYSDESFRAFHAYWTEILKQIDLLRKEESQVLKQVFGCYGGIDCFVESYQFDVPPNLEGGISVRILPDSPNLRPSFNQKLRLDDFTESEYFHYENKIQGLIKLISNNDKLMARDHFDNRNHIWIRKNYLKIFDMKIPDMMKLALIYVDWATDWIGGGDDYKKDDYKKGELKYLLECCSKNFGVDFSELSSKYEYCSRVRNKMKGSKE